MLFLTKYKGYLYVAMVVLVASLFFWIGYKVAAGSYEQRLFDIANAISESYKATIETQNALIDKHNQELKVERDRFNKVQREKVVLDKRSQGIIDETIKAGNSSCRWPTDHRMRLKSLYQLYGKD